MKGATEVESELFEELRTLAVELEKAEPKAQRNLDAPLLVLDQSVVSGHRLSFFWRSRALKEYRSEECRCLGPMYCG